jgi:hypothetical protein
MRVGEKVCMTEGPFFGMYGTIVISLRGRVVLAIVLGSREVLIEIESSWFSAAPRRPSISRIENPKLSRRKAG